jgi:hypothetical protein
MPMLVATDREVVVVDVEKARSPVWRRIPPAGPPA